jgi:glutathione peroxidase
MANDFYQLVAKTPAGKEVPFSTFKGKVVLVVNTATQCAFAPQFEGLEKLYQDYKDKGLLIVGFPSNQFGNQEPESNETMTETCKINFGVTFPLFEKTEVNGENAHPVFKYLKAKLGSLLGRKIKWNFTKFLVDADGKPIKRFSSFAKPESIEPYIKRLLTSAGLKGH